MRPCEASQLKMHTNEHMLLVNRALREPLQEAQLILWLILCDLIPGRAVTGTRILKSFLFQTSLCLSVSFSLILPLPPFSPPSLKVKDQNSTHFNCYIKRT